METFAISAFAISILLPATVISHDSWCLYPSPPSLFSAQQPDWPLQKFNMSQLFSSLYWLPTSHWAKDEVMTVTSKDLFYLHPVTSWTHLLLTPYDPCPLATITSLCQTTYCGFLRASCLFSPLSDSFPSSTWLDVSLTSFVLCCHLFHETRPDCSVWNPCPYFLLSLSPHLPYFFTLHLSPSAVWS